MEKFPSNNTNQVTTNSSEKTDIPSFKENSLEKKFIIKNVEKSVSGSFTNVSGDVMVLSSPNYRNHKFLKGLLHNERCSTKSPLFWFMQGEKESVLQLTQEQFTNFPNENRSYAQNASLVFRNEEINGVNTGDLFSSCGVFENYDSNNKYNDQGEIFRLSETIEGVTKEFPISEKFSSFMKEIATTRKKIIILSPELPIRANEFASYPLFQKVFYGIGSLDKTLQRKISVGSHILKAEQDVQLDNPEWAEYEKKNTFQKIASKKPEQKITKKTFEILGASPTNILFCYGDKVIRGENMYGPISTLNMNDWTIMSAEEIMAL